MTTRRRRSRWLAATAGALVVIAAAATGVVLKDQSSLPDRPPGQRPQLLLLTTLPIVFPDRFTLDAEASPALEALRSRYEVEPISTADAKSLGLRRLLLMAQPRAQPAEALVELDQWVRSGGRLLLLADPALEWPNDRPLGDVLRPPAAFADTGLLGHWGLRLDAPDQAGRATFTAGERLVQTESPGSLVATGRQCVVTAKGLVARCRIGQGEATVIADADFLNVDGKSGGATPANFELLLAELARLEQ